MVHKRTKALAIPSKVKEVVYERDKHKCVLCKKYVDVSNACCHFIARSQGGLGIEQNIITLCNECHRDFDNSERRKEYKRIIRWYLKKKYENWNEKELTYNKWNIQT